MIPLRKICNFLFAIASAASFHAYSLAATVTNTNDSGTGSLRQAIIATPADGTIDFALSGCPCTIVLTSGELSITRPVTIIGPGPNQLTISGNNASRIFLIIGPSSPLPKDQIEVALEGIKIANGLAGIYPPFPPLNFGGGGIMSVNTRLTVRNSTISNNRAEDGGGVQSVSGTAFIINCVISHNIAETGGGGIIDDGGTLTISDSTISDNLAGFTAGGVVARVSTTLQISNSTIARNTSPGLYIWQYSTADIVGSTIEGHTGGLAIVNISAITNINNSTISGNGPGYAVLNDSFSDFKGGIIHSRLTITNSTITSNDGGVVTRDEPKWPATTTLRNTIVAGSVTFPDVAIQASGIFVSSGYNLIGNAGTVTVFNQPGDQAGTPGSPIDPRLEPLAFNGGPTRTHALRLNSSAVDRGKSFGSIADQRGLIRPNDNPELTNAVDGDGSDIGAYEIQFPLLGTISIKGHVNFSGGVAMSRGFVTLTDSGQNIRYAPVNPAGYYRFTNVPLGRAISIGLMSKGWFVEPQTIFISEPLTDLDLEAVRGSNR
jgi:hypothetical protein